MASIYHMVSFIIWQKMMDTLYFDEFWDMVLLYVLPIVVGLSISFDMIINLWMLIWWCNVLYISTARFAAVSALGAYSLSQHLSKVPVTESVLLHLITLSCQFYDPANHLR